MSDKHVPTPSDDTVEVFNGVDVTVGPVNVAFTPLSPDITPSEALSEQTSVPEAQAGDADATPPPLQPSSRSPSTPWGCLHDLVLVLIGAILTLVLVFAILLAINGTLRLNEREQAIQLALQQARLEEQLTDLQGKMTAQEQAIQTLDGRIQALQARTDAIEQATETTRQRVGKLEMAQQGVAEDVAALDAQMMDLAKTTEGIQGDVESFQQAFTRFNRFVHGLAQLLAEMNAETGFREITPSVSITSTSIFTVTVTVTPTVTITPTPTATATPTPLVASTSQSEALRLFPPLVPLPTPRADRGVIYGLVWEDADGDGQPEAGETPMPGVAVMLKTAQGRRLLTMVTGVDGRYAFVHVPPGAYLVALLPDVGQSPRAQSESEVAVAGGDFIEINFGMR